jgi:hypothetical protein
MLIDPEQLLKQAASISKTSGASEWASLMRVLLERLAPLSDALPTVAAAAAKTAHGYWMAGERESVDLLAAKESCWTYLEAGGDSASVNTTDGRLTRAVLCVLEPDGDSDAASTTAEWFAAMLAPIAPEARPGALTGV